MVHRGEAILGGAQHQVVVPPMGGAKWAAPSGSRAREGPDGLQLGAPRLVQRGEIGRGVGGDVPAVNLAHLGGTVGAHAAGQPDLVGDDVRCRADAAVLQVAGPSCSRCRSRRRDGDDAAGGRGQVADSRATGGSRSKSEAGTTFKRTRVTQFSRGGRRRARRHGHRHQVPVRSVRMSGATSRRRQSSPSPPARAGCSICR